MLRNLYDLADMKVMHEIPDSRAFTEYCCINSPDEVPDRDTNIKQDTSVTLGLHAGCFLLASLFS